MSTISILNDKVTSITIQFLNSAGTSVNAPTGDSFTAVSSAPTSLEAAITGPATAPVLVLTPLVQAGTGYTVTVSDSKGLTPVTATINVAPDPTLATQLALGVLNTAPQPVPTAPGP